MIGLRMIGLIREFMKSRCKSSRSSSRYQSRVDEPLVLDIPVEFCAPQAPTSFAASLGAFLGVTVGSIQSNTLVFMLGRKAPFIMGAMLKQIGAMLND